MLLPSANSQKLSCLSCLYYFRHLPFSLKYSSLINLQHLNNRLLSLGGFKHPKQRAKLRTSMCQHSIFFKEKVEFSPKITLKFVVDYQDIFFFQSSEREDFDSFFSRHCAKNGSN
jgi:hypothetical protein